jgi:Glycosyl hydrolase 108
MNLFQKPNLFLIAILIFFNTITSSNAADCKKAIEIVFAHEGGYQNSKKDAGNWSSGKVGVGYMCGGTKYGIACGHNPGIKISELTLDQAGDIYQKKQCIEIRMSELNGQILPTLMLDLTINMGARATIGLIGNTVNLLNADDQHIEISDHMSDEMVKWYNFYTEDNTRRKLFYATLTLTAIDRYAQIVESNKTQSVWLLGWIRRVIPNEIEELTKSKVSPLNLTEIKKEAQLLSFTNTKLNQETKSLSKQTVSEKKKIINNKKQSNKKSVRKKRKLKSFTNTKKRKK